MAEFQSKFNFDQNIFQSSTSSDESFSYQNVLFFFFFHAWNETWKFNETYCLEDTFVDKTESFPGKTWWKAFVLTKSNKKTVSTSSCYSTLCSVLEQIQT